MNWRLDLAQKCIDRAEARLLEGRDDMAERLAQNALNLMREAEELDDYEAGRRDGRVITIRPRWH